MSENLTHVNVLDEPGLYAVRSGSASVYYVDSRIADEPPLYLRARGRGLTLDSHMDNAWHALVALKSYPYELNHPVEVSADDAALALTEDWALRVGCPHYYETRRPGHPRGDVYWVVSRAAWEIVRLDDMPPPDDLTIPEREVFL